MMYIYLNTPAFPVGVLNIKVSQGKFEATSLAITSIIMILYNFYSWINFSQKLDESPRFAKIEHEMDRAKLLIAEIDQVCAFCTSIR